MKARKVSESRCIASLGRIFRQVFYDDIAHLLLIATALSQLAEVGVKWNVQRG